MNRLYDFIQEVCATYGIDESHDVSHAKDCVDLANIMSHGDEDKEMITYAAALHDCVDKKYLDPSEGTQLIRAFLTTEGWTPSRIVSLLQIITTISYSYLNKIKINNEIVFPNHGNFQREYHIVREADLLCSFRVRRCYLYQKHISPNMKEPETWKKVSELFEARMFKYVENGWFTIPKAKSMALKFTELARSDLDTVKWIYSDV